MNDSERLDAIAKYGLCIATHDEFRDGKWIRHWIAAQDDSGDVIIADTLREAIDLAVLNSAKVNGKRH